MLLGTTMSLAKLTLASFITFDIAASLMSDVFGFGPLPPFLESILATVVSVVLLALKSNGFICTSGLEHEHLLKFDACFLMPIQVVVLSALFFQSAVLHKIVNPYLDEVKEAWVVMWEGLV